MSNDPANASGGQYVDPQAATGDDKCAEILAKYPVDSYNKQKNSLPQGQESHHVMQNAHFCTQRYKAVAGIAAGYTIGSAPCIPLAGVSTDPLTPHGLVTKMQKDVETSMKGRTQNPTYKEAQNNAIKQIKAADPTLSDEDVKCIMAKVDEYFREAMGNISQEDLLKREVRILGQRGAWAPTTPPPAGSVTLTPS